MRETPVTRKHIFLRPRVYIKYQSNAVRRALILTRPMVT